MATEIFLKIDGINGEARDDSHLDEIDVHAWRWRAEQESAMLSGGGGKPKCSVHDLVVVHAIDKATPNLMAACLTSRKINKAVLTLRKAGGTPIDFFKITLSDVIITCINPHGNEGGHFEEIHLSFSKIKQEYLLQNSLGGSAGMVTGSFDIKNNRQD